jgi:methyl-accepting chemotaxis protein
MASWKPDLSADGDELAQRVARLRQQSEALEEARSAAEQGRDLIDQMKEDAEDVYKALTFDKPPR